MYFDEFNLPIEDNASDKQDSARLAGIMVAFNYPNSDKIDLKLYCKKLESFNGNFILSSIPEFIKTIQYLRHPNEYIYDFSRDQLICLMAGLSKNYKPLVSNFYANGKDFLSPTVKGHEARCKGLKASWLQDLWLKADMFIHAKFTPLAESNQLFCMLKIAGPEWIRSYCKMNPKWREGLRKYWIDTRAKPEKELCEHMIKEIEKCL